MPTQLVFLLAPFLFLFLTGCREDPVRPPITGPGPDSIDCPAPLEGIYGYRSPQYASTRQAVSQDGTFLAYVDGETGLHVLDLGTGEDRLINVQSKLPVSTTIIGLTTLLWSPQPPNRLLLHTATITDTSITPPKRVYGHNTYIISFEEDRLQRITPDIFGPAGSREGYGILDWLSGSNSSSDSIHLGNSRGIFIPQEQKFVTNHYPYFYKQNRSGSLYLGLEYRIAVNELIIYLNGSQIYLPKRVQMIKNASWSPDGKTLALTVMPEERGPKGTFEQIWILDAEKILRERPDTASFDVIDLQKRFCSYSFLGCHAEFITDSTLAVSMHPDGGSSPLWEISLDGRKIRQLTFLP